MTTFTMKQLIDAQEALTSAVGHQQIYRCRARVEHILDVRSQRTPTFPWQTSQDLRRADEQNSRVGLRARVVANRKANGGRLF